MAAKLPSGAVRLLEENMHGDLALLLDGQGAPVGSETYDPFGTPRVVAGEAQGSLFGYQGDPTDPDTGQVDMGTRLYDPAQGRFTSRDTIVGDPTDPVTLNQYIYADANPVTMTDPTGMYAFGGSSNTNTRVPDKNTTRAAQQSVTNYTESQVAPAEAAADYYNNGAAQHHYGYTPPRVVEAPRPVHPAPKPTAAGPSLTSRIKSGGGRFVAGVFSWIVPEEAQAEAPMGIAGDMPGAGAGGEVPEIRGAVGDTSTWKRSETLADHFGRHGGDFDSATQEEYARQASAFFRRAASEGLPTKVDIEGTIRIYDPGTNTFGSYNPDGTTKTFYKPDPSVHGYKTNLEYWETQPGNVPWRNMMCRHYMCPVCGYSHLTESPWTDGIPSDQICPCCGTQFGYDDAAGGDAARRQAVYRSRREAWQERGCPWFSRSIPPPAQWDPKKQLASLMT